jgi:LysM repeat protein
MYIRNILIALFIFSSLHMFANIDSTGVQNNKGKKLIIHKVEAQETYYSLGRKYGVDPKTIMDFNNNIPLQIGTVLNIPTERPFDEQSSPKKSSIKSKPRSSPTFVKHKVKSGETLSEIAEDYDTSVKTIQKLNNMRGTSIRMGQTIKVRQINPSTPAEEPEITRDAGRNTIDDKDSSETKSDPSPKIDASRYGLREHMEHGTATLIEDKNIDGTKLLVLHRTAPVGTVIKITNPATEKSTFAKVVGNFTDNENTKDAIIVLTKAVSDLIGGMEKRFEVTIDYGLNE